MCFDEGRHVISIIYVLTNPAFEGYVKIGKTANLKQRLRNLDNTSVPLPFRCEYASRVSDMNAVEKLLHDAFGDRRVRDNREFFEIDPLRVVSALKLAGGKEVTPSDDVAEDEAGVTALNKSKTMRVRFKFTMVDIPVGSVLTFSKDSQYTAIVHDDTKILFEGEVTTLSNSALKIMTRSGFRWKAIQGAAFWMFDDETLVERRNRIEREVEKEESE